MRDNDPAVRLTSVAKSFAGRRSAIPVFTNVDLTIQRGEMIAVVGRNGVGKSTLIRLIAGLLLPDAGQVRVTDAHGRPVDPALEPGTASAVFDGSRGLYWRLTVAENLRYLARLDGIAPDVSKRLAEPWLERFGLAAKRDELVQSLSKGTQQKVSLVRALMLAKPLLLFDEPTTLLDDESARTLAEALRERCRAGLTVLIATHDREFIAHTVASPLLVESLGVTRAAAPGAAGDEAARAALAPFGASAAQPMHR